LQGLQKQLFLYKLLSLKKEQFYENKNFAFN